MLEKETDNVAFEEFLRSSNIKPVRSDLLVLFGPCSIVLNHKDADLTRDWLKEKNIQFVEIEIIII
ncbi:MAG: hypothetical protein WC303_00425 [Candidatus Paceibacterota bacterium]|jgi:hypothetical protein